MGLSCHLFINSNAKKLCSFHLLFFLVIFYSSLECVFCVFFLTCLKVLKIIKFVSLTFYFSVLEANHCDSCIQFKLHSTMLDKALDLTCSGTTRADCLLDHRHTDSANQCPAFRCSIFHKLS